LGSYLPPELTFTNVDDDLNAAAVGSFFTVDPKDGCHVYESGSFGANGTDCALTFAISDVVSKTFDTGTNNYFYLVTLTLQQPADSTVYFSDIMTGGAVQNGSACSVGPNCGHVTLWWPETTYDWSALAASVQLATVDDWLDDGDQSFNVTVAGSVVYGCSSNEYNPTVGMCTGTLTSGGNATYTVSGQEMDDDTAGLVFSQGMEMFYSYRKERTDGLEADLTSLATVELPLNVTSEAGWASSTLYVEFDVALSSKPDSDVTVTFYAVSFNDEYGLSRYEGIPSLNRAKIDGGGYVLDSYVSPASWVNASGSKDTLVDPSTGGLALTFKPMNWNMPQSVTVIGLDDLAADGDKPFNIEAMVVGTVGDKYRYAPEENLFDQAVRLPFLNLDNEKATVGYSAEQVGALVAEPFYGDSARIEVYTTTEPADVIWLSFSSTKPWIANTTHELVAITPSNWDQKLVVHVNAVDNFVDGGNSSFDVEMLVLGSSDQAYGNLMQNQNFAFTKFDDPDDAGFSSSSDGVAMEFMRGRNLAGVVQAFTTEYGGDGSILGDAEKSGSATLQVRLTKLTQDDVTYAINTSDITEGQVLYPSVVVFMPDNYYEWQEVVVVGRSDTIADGDVTYDIEFHLLGTNDPYYRALPLQNTTQSLENLDTFEQPMALGISSFGCYNTIEGTEASHGYALSGLDACVVTFTICLSDTGTCTQELTAQEVFNASTSRALGLDTIALDVYMNDTAVAYVGQPAFNQGQINVTSDGRQARVVLGLGRALETSFNLTVYATDNIINNQKRVTELNVYGVLRRDANMGSEEIQDFVNFYDDAGDATFTKDRGDGELVNYGMVPIIVLANPSLNPTSGPSLTPVSTPTPYPSLTPSTIPTPVPKPAPTPVPSLMPSLYPSLLPTPAPSVAPSVVPTRVPISSPNDSPSSEPSPVPSLVPTATMSPTLNPTLTPSPDPTSEPSLAPVPAMTPLPTTYLSFDPSLVPSSVSAHPSPVPSLEPSPVPSLHPTRSPTLQPTTTDTISVAVSLAMTATAEPTVEDKKSLKSAIASSLDIDEGYLKGFTIVSEATARRWVRRTLLASYTWNVAFTVKSPLSETTFDSSTSYSESMVSALTSDSFVSSVLSSVGATVDVTSISSEVTTTRNTPQPTVSVVAIGNGGEVEAQGSSGSDESSSDAMTVFVLLGVLVFAAIAAGLFFLRRRLIAKRDDERITNESDAGVKLGAVQVETPTASLTFGASMQPPKAGSIIKFLQEEAKILSARTLFVADQFAKHGYESASDFKGMTALELSDEHLRDEIGLVTVHLSYDIHSYVLYNYLKYFLCIS